MNGQFRKTATAKRLRRIVKPAWCGTLRRVSPLSPSWGTDRGTPIDRYYISAFLEENRADIHGRVLEVKDNSYTRTYGESVTRSDVLDVDSSNPSATVIANLASGVGLPSNLFDCFILTQTLQYVYDVQSAVANCHRALKPGGVALITVPCTSRMVQETEHYADYWRFTGPCCTKLFADVFGAADVRVGTFGNVLTNIAFLTGMAHEELTKHELETSDPDFPLIVTVRATKANNILEPA